MPLFEAQRRLSHLLSDAGADFIPLTVDSYTRHNQYDIAAELLHRSEEEEKNYLNGYPLVCHGYELTRELYRDLDKPVSLRHGTPDARLLAEVAIASGITEIEGGGICYCLPYSEGFPLDRCLLYWQYVDRICALHSSGEFPIHRESFGPLTATLVPPAVAIAVEVLEALLAAEQGVKSFSVSFGQTGSVSQDIATAQVLRKLTAGYLAEFGFSSVSVYVVYHQWMGHFPSDRPRASALIACSAFVANMVGADKIVVKTVDEALGVPDPEVNAEAVECVRYVFRTLPCEEQLGSTRIDAESSLIESEARSILDAVFKLPGDVFWESVFRAFRLGYIDVPFSPHSDNANRLIPMRDASGAIRIKEAGLLPIRQADKEKELELLELSPRKSEKTYQRVLSDINLMI